MRDVRPTEEQLNEKRNYIVMNTGHERYSFETNLSIYRGKSLKEIAEEEFNVDERYLFVHRPDFPDEHNYVCDCSCWSELDTQYTNPGLPADKLQHIHLDMTYIFDLDEFLASEYASIVWGQTENKFGLIDIKRDCK